MSVILKQGDCLELIKEIPTGSVDMVLTDPPYHVGVTCNSQKSTFNELSMLKPFFVELFGEFRRVLKEDGLAYVFTDWRTLPFIQPLLNEKLGMKNLIVWDKAGRMTANYGFYHELVLFAGNRDIARVYF